MRIGTLGNAPARYLGCVLRGKPYLTSLWTRVNAPMAGRGEPTEYAPPGLRLLRRQQSRALGAPLPPALPPRVRDVHHLALRLTGRSPSATREARENPISRHAALPLCSAASSPGALDSAASVSAISRRMMSPTERTSLMPPAVWPAVSRHSCGRPAWVVETI